MPNQPVSSVNTHSFFSLKFLLAALLSEVWLLALQHPSKELLQAALCVSCSFECILVSWCSGAGCVGNQAIESVSPGRDVRTTGVFLLIPFW